MTLNEHLMRLSEYKIGFNIYEGTVIISVIYPDKWTVLQSKDTSIQMTKDGDRDYYYVSLDVDIEKVFALIDETIQYNKEVEAKALLFKEKISELKQVFLVEELETLKTLEFRIKKKRGPKTNEKKAISEEQTKRDEDDIAIKEDINDNDTEIKGTAMIEPSDNTDTNNESGVDIDKKIQEAMKEKEG